MQHQLVDYGLDFSQTPIYCDNNAAIQIVKNPVYFSKTKHIAIKEHFIRDSYNQGLILMEQIHTNDNVADLFTKPVDRARFKALLELLKMVHFED